MAQLPLLTYFFSGWIGPGGWRVRRFHNNVYLVPGIRFSTPQNFGVSQTMIYRSVRKYHDRFFLLIINPNDPCVEGQSGSIQCIARRGAHFLHRILFHKKKASLVFLFFIFFVISCSRAYTTVYCYYWIIVRASWWFPRTRLCDNSNNNHRTDETDHDLDHLAIDPHLPLWYAVHDLCGTDPTQESRSRSSRFYGSHTATWATLDHSIDEESIFPGWI